ncbi:probable L-ascorbate peroxidase 8, chloroplastic isoform X1 [Miscanthus floridulus]|uniref:probable L-ascorbate peroxidase 8, chloroplastic isoform X1 n=1 Tax=Miscanthus floridulus TaxID=154761 RepID=UPI003457CC50
MAERLAASLLPSASPSPSARRATVAAAAAASFPFPCSARAGLRLRSRQPLLSQKAAGRGRGVRVVRCMAASDAAQLKGAREDIKELLRTTYCHPILVRLGWHDSGTYDKNIEEWPQRGGADGSLRFDAELSHGANAGLINALKLIQPIKDKYPGITYADLFQLASATAIEEAGGPKIPIKYGRVDVTAAEQCPPEGRLPDAGPRDPAEHLREVFYRMGLDDKEIVALSGAHTLGRARPDRSGWGKPETKYTKDGPGEPGGQSWTVEWLKFDNSYFKDMKFLSQLPSEEQKEQDLLVLPTDAALFEDPSFKVYAEKYAEDQEAFFKDYAEAHAKLSDLGAKFDPPEGFSLDDDVSAAPADEKTEAALSFGERLKQFLAGISWKNFQIQNFLFFLKKLWTDLLKRISTGTPWKWGTALTLEPWGTALTLEPSVAAAPPPVAPEPEPAAEPTPEPVAAAVATATADDNNGAAPQPEPFVAAKYSYGKRELSESMKQKIRAEYEGFGGSPDKPMQSNYFLNIMILIAGLAFLTSLVGN